MALFRRNTANQDLPEEVRQYYAAEQRDRSWLAWLLALGSLVVVVLIVAGLFFGGRWIYREIKHSNKTASTSNTANNPSPTPANNQPKPPTPAPTPTPTPTPPTGSSNATGTTGSSATSGSATSGATAQSGNGKLTNTGPGEIITVAFMAATLAGTGAHYLYIRRKLTA
jgi:cytoskeletal protein RodZ